MSRFGLLRSINVRRQFSEVPSKRHGAWSVLIITGIPNYDADAKTLSFNLDETNLVKQGSTGKTLVIADAENARPERGTTSPQGNVPHQTLQSSSGDKQFLNELPKHLRELGDAVLSGVREWFPGPTGLSPNFWEV